MNNAFSAYKKQSVTTLTPGDVVVKLYMEAERQLNRASYYIPLKNYEETNKALIKAQDEMCIRDRCNRQQPVEP